MPGICFEHAQVLHYTCKTWRDGSGEPFSCWNFHPHLLEVILKLQLFSFLRQENPRFHSVLSRLEEDPICQRLPLTSFLILPFQRITRLKMLVEVWLQDSIWYLKLNYLQSSAVDGCESSRCAPGCFLNIRWKQFCGIFFRISWKGHLQDPGMRTLPQRLSMS